MNISGIKAKARESLKGNWGTAVLITLCLYGILYAANFISAFSGGLLGIAITIITIPLEFGMIFSFLKIRKKEDVGVGDFFNLGFKNFAKSWGIVGNTLLKIWVPLVVLIVSLVVLIIGIVIISIGGVQDEIAILLIGLFIIIAAFIGYMISIVWLYVKGLLYSLANIIAMDNEELTAKEAIEKSEEMMKGNRGKYFLLNLSFIGWSFLTVFTLGIGILWLIPYMEFSNIEFYEELKASKEQ